MPIFCLLFISNSNLLEEINMINKKKQQGKKVYTYQQSINNTFFSFLTKCQLKRGCALVGVQQTNSLRNYS